MRVALLVLLFYISHLNNNDCSISKVLRLQLFLFLTAAKLCRKYIRYGWETALWQMSFF